MRLLFVLIFATLAIQSCKEKTVPNTNLNDTEILNSDQLSDENEKESLSMDLSNSEVVNELVENIGKTFKNSYVFPDKGKNLNETLLTKLKNGDYYGYTNKDSLALKLKSDMIAITNDKHISVKYIGNTGGNDNGGGGMDDFFNQFDNFGFTKSEILHGNIGYVKIDIFYPTQMNPEAGNVAQKIMQSFKNCSALIFDLRNCRGGDPAMLDLLITYLYPVGSKIHLNDFYDRPSGGTRSSYTLDKVEGRRFVNEPVYVLTSNKSFSCAEEFAYDLKHLDRAIIIGETTGGGAHPVRGMLFKGEFDVSVPTGRAINPITKTNWEDVGVIPDIKVKQEDALNKALELIN